MRSWAVVRPYADAHRDGYVNEHANIDALANRHFHPYENAHSNLYAHIHARADGLDGFE